MLTTRIGDTFPDFLVKTLERALTVGIAGVLLLIATLVQLPAGRDIPWWYRRISGNEQRFLRDGPDEASEQGCGQYSRSEDAGEHHNLEPSGFQG